MIDKVLKTNLNSEQWRRENQINDNPNVDSKKQKDLFYSSWTFFIMSVFLFNFLILEFYNGFVNVKLSQITDSGDFKCRIENEVHDFDEQNTEMKFN